MRITSAAAACLRAVRRPVTAGAITLGLLGVPTVATITDQAIHATPAFAADQPIGAVWMPDSTGCQAWISGRNVPIQAHAPNTHTTYTYGGPSLAIRYENYGGGGCNWVRFNIAVNCPSIFLFTWVLTEPAYYRDVFEEGITFYQPATFYLPGYPTCQFFGWYLELNGNGQDHCWQWSIVDGIHGVACHAYPSSSADPEIWPHDVKH